MSKHVHTSSGARHAKGSKALKAFTQEVRKQLGRKPTNFELLERIECGHGTLKQHRYD